MARRGGSRAFGRWPRRSRRQPSQRDARRITNPLMSYRVAGVRIDNLRHVRPPVNLDGRTFTPSRMRPVLRKRDGRLASRVISAATGYRNPLRVLRFRWPLRLLVCARRRQRREVLHALQRTGKGSGGGRRRRNFYSEVFC